jgi:hypothetical protein
MNLNQEQELVIKKIKDLKDRIQKLELQIINKSEELQTFIIEALELENEYNKQNQMQFEKKENKFTDASNIFTHLEDD